MTPITSQEEIILEKVKNLSPQQQQQVLEFIDFLQLKTESFESVKTQEKEPISFLESAKEFIGCVQGGPGDLATNKEYLKGVGSK